MRQLENRKPNLTPAKRSPAVSVNLHRKFSRAIGGHFLAIRINSIGCPFSRATSLGDRRLLCSHRKVGQISGQSRAASVFITAVLGTELIDEKHEVKPIRAVINGFAKFK